ncbi:MAG: hypothetical protein ACR2GX_01165 [Candidatus Dormibacteria bacterium]
MVTTFVGSDVRAWPSLTRAARFLGVEPSTLSRRDDLNGERAGRQEIRVSPTTVVHLSREYRRRGPDEVAHDLIDHARRKAADQVPAVEAEIDHYLASNPAVASTDRVQLLELAHRHLPPELCTLIERAVAADGRRGVIGAE